MINEKLIHEQDPVFLASPSASITNNDIQNWNNKSDFSGSYNDLENKPTIPTMATSAGTSTTNGYAQSYINSKLDNSITTIINSSYSFSFSGNVYATKTITLPKNISNYKYLYFLIGDGYYDGFFIPANLLVSGNSFRKRILMGTIQSYMEIKYNSANSVFIQLEHTAAISGSKNISIKIYSIIN